MRRLVKLSMVLLVVIMFLPTCKKSSNPTNCLVVSATQGKRKIVFEYLNGVVLSRITDYSDSTNILTANTFNFSYNQSGGLSAVTEAHESGLFDSISFEYPGGSKIRQKQYRQVDNSMVLEYSRSFILDAHGLITSDTLYGLLPVRKGMIISNYTTYTYDAGFNLQSLTNFLADGTSYYNDIYSYSDTVVTNNSYNIARFTCLWHHGNDYQYIFPVFAKLPSHIQLSAVGMTQSVTCTYDLDANKNPVTDYLTSEGCPECSLTFHYRYGCN